MDNIKEQVKKSTAILDPYAASVPVFVDVAAKAGVNPGAILAGILSVLMLIILMMQGWTILVTIVTVLYPALLSIRAIESEDDKDDKVWLTYWMVFGVFTVAETFFGFVFYFIPYWDWIRVVFFVWLLVPQFNGAAFIYDNVLRKVLNDNKDLVQKWITEATSAAAKAQAEAKSKAANVVSDPTLVAQGLSMASQAQNAAKEMADSSDQTKQ